jgi:spermidine/putrescine transport system ATP-binding protein
MTQTTSSKPPDAIATDPPQLDVELRNVVKLFEGEPAVRGIDLGIKRGEFFSILGPSGCGKTTTLRMIAGFEDPTSGELLLQGKSMAGVPPHKRPVNTVFQSYALFNHMSVWDNIAFGLRIRNCAKNELRERVGQALQLVRMESFARRYPTQLSGGQRQRVALARALVNRPTVMLLDEPLGALDLKLRKQMQVEVSNLHQQLGISFVMVTHDQEEALSLSDRIAVMKDGEIEQIGTPQEIYEYPATAFVADFIGDTNLLSGQLETLDAQMKRVTTHNGLSILAKIDQTNGHATQPGTASISVRPEKIQLAQQVPERADNCFEGRVKHMMYMGTHLHCVVELATGECLTVFQSNQNHHAPNPDSPVYAFWAADDCRILAH